MSDYYSEDGGVDDDIESIISQIKNQSQGLSKPKSVYPEISEDGLDDFLRERAIQLIVDSQDTMTHLKDTIQTPQEMQSFATLTNAVKSAMDFLQKKKIADNKNITQKEVTQMNIDAQANNKNEKDNSGFLVSREDVIKALMNKTDDKKNDTIDPPTVDI